MKKLIGLGMGIVLVLALTAMVPASAALVAHWNFNEGSGITFTDSINGNVGTIWEDGWTTNYAGAWTAGRTGGPLDYALDFEDGTLNAHAVVPDNISLHISDEITIDFWIKAKAQSQWPSIIKKVTGDGIGWDIKAQQNARSLGFRVGTDAGTSSDNWMWSGVLSGSWQRIIVTAGNGVINAYLGDLNNNIVSGTYPQGTGFANSAPIHIATWGVFEGQIDDIKIYNNVIPEPGSLFLLGTGLLGLVSLVRRKRS